MQRRLVLAAVLMVCGFVAWLVVLSNHYDWDVFYALNEVDRRAWLIDRELPLWTYQLCGGMSRLADPQAFGLSPLFVLVLLFGSFWGTKLWVLAALAIAVYFAARLFELCEKPERVRPGPWASQLVPALLLVFSNYFLWHLLVGHFTFTGFCLAIAILYLTLAGYWRGLSRAEFALGVLIAWQHYAGGFFHSLVYLMVPFALAFALFVPLDLWMRHRAGPSGVRSPLGRLWGAGSFHGVGLLLAFPRLWAVWSYEPAVPRNLSASMIEATGADQVALHLTVPTFRLDWLVPGLGGQLHAVHEYSSFSLLVPLVVVAVALALGSRAVGGRPAGPRRWNGPVVLAILFLGVAGLLSLGDAGGWAPFAWLNAHLLRGAVRIPSRFEIGIVVAAGMIFCAFSRSGPASRLGAPSVRLALLLLLALNLATFLPLTSMARLREVLALPSAPQARMNAWNYYPVYPPDHGGVGRELERSNTSQMYRHVLMGRGIDNCYNALPVPRKRPVTRKLLPLVDAAAGAPDRDCVEQSYFTQNRVVLDKACPELTCVNISWLNPLERDSEWVEQPAHGRYCRDRRRAGAE